MKYMNLIKTVALLRQYQKEIKEGNDGVRNFEYIEVDKKDIEIANKIANKIFPQALSEVTPQTDKFLKLVYAMVKRIVDETQKDQLDIVISRRQMREYTGWSDYQVRKHIDELSQLEYLVPVGGQRGKRFTYILVWDPDNQKHKEVKLESVDNL